MDSVLHVKRFNPIPFLSWEREKKERSEPKINTMYTPPYLTSHILISFHMKPCGTVHIFYIFVNFKKKSAGLFLILGEHCVSAPSAFAPLSNGEVCKVPSAGQVEILQQTLHAKFGWNSWQQRAPYRLTYPSNFRYEIHVIFLAKSEDILPASSQLQKFFKGTFALELRKSIKSHIL